MRQLTKGVLLVGGVVLLACMGGPSADAEQNAKGSSVVSEQVRDAALASARVWLPPAVPISQANLRENPSDPGGFVSSADVTCKFTVQNVGGTTPKFYCELPGGEVVKVKYGSGYAELPAEVA